MIAVDTNILVYAHREDSPWHSAAIGALLKLEERGQRWAIPWPCIYEFYSVVTHPSIFETPTTSLIALNAIGGWMESDLLRLLSESENCFAEFHSHINALDIRGPRIHDARIAILCASHGVHELWTMDRDFSRFPFLKTRNPLT